MCVCVCIGGGKVSNVNPDRNLNIQDGGIGGIGGIGRLIGRFLSTKKFRPTSFVDQPGL